MRGRLSSLVPWLFSVFGLVPACRSAHWRQPLKKFFDRDPVVVQTSNQSHALHQQATPSSAQSRPKPLLRAALTADGCPHTHRCPCDQRSHHRQTALWVGPLSLPRIRSQVPLPGPHSLSRPPGHHARPRLHPSPHRPAETTSKEETGQPGTRAWPWPRTVLAACSAFTGLISLWAALQGPSCQAARLCPQNPTRKSGHRSPTSRLPAL